MGHGLRIGTPELASVGPIAFGPDDVLFVADNVRATVLAIDVADPAPAATGTEPFDVSNVDARLASFLGCGLDDVHVRDMAVHPRTHNVYLSVQRGLGDSAVPVVVRIDHLDGSVGVVAFENVAFDELRLSDAPANDDERVVAELGRNPDAQEFEFNGVKLLIARRPARTATVTDLAYVDGTLIIAGMSNEEFASTLRRVAFPFDGNMVANSLEIFHVSHGAWETAAPIRTFVPYEGGRSILASYTCTPLVHVPLEGAAPGEHVKGRTVAELGPMNQPLDIVAFEQDGEDYVLVSNTRHPLLKISCRDIDAQEALTTPGEPEGARRDAEELAGVSKMANLNGSHLLVLQEDEKGRHLRSLKTASL
jgi:hypothetical protein